MVRVLHAMTVATSSNVPPAVQESARMMPSDVGVGSVTTVATSAASFPQAVRAANARTMITAKSETAPAMAAKRMRWKNFMLSSLIADLPTVKDACVRPSLTAAASRSSRGGHPFVARKYESNIIHQDLAFLAVVENYKRNFLDIAILTEY